MKSQKIIGAKGYMTKILSAMIDYIFNHTDIEMIIAAYYILTRRRTEFKRRTI